MRKIVLSLSFLFLITLVFCQSYEKTYRTSEDEEVGALVQINEDQIIFAMNHGSYINYDYQVKLFKLQISSGEIVDSVHYEFNHPKFKVFGISKLLLFDTLIIGFGSCKNTENDTNANFIIHINNNFEIIFDTLIGNGVGSENYIYYDVKKNSSNQLLIVGMQTPNTPIIEERDFYGNLLRKQAYPNDGYLASTVIEISHKNQYQLYSYWDNEHRYYIINKDNLQIEDTLHYPLGYLPREVIEGKDSSYYYLAGRQQHIEPEVDNLLFYKVNDEGVFVEEHEYLTDTITFYGYDAFNYNEDYIYFGGTHIPTWIPPLEMYPEPHRLVIFKLNHSGELIWQKYYKGEVCYYMTNITATSDGGALIFSTRYDWEDPYPLQRDVHILKIDSLGNYIPAGQDEPLIIENQILVYPNPVKNKVHFSFGFYSNLQINIYNLQGQILFSEIFYHSTDIDMSKFPVGVYLYIITSNKGFFEKGKLIKE